MALGGAGPSVKASLFGAIAIAGLVTVLVGALLSIRDFRAAERAAIETAFFEASLGVDALSASIDELTETVASVAGEPDITSVLRATPDQCALAGGGAGVFGSVHLDLMRPDGAVVCSSVSRTGAPRGASHTGATWIADITGSGQPFVTPLFADRLSSGAPSIAVVAPLRERGRSVGAFVAVAHVEALGTELAERLGGRERYRFTVLDPATTTVITSSVDPGLSSAPISESPFTAGIAQGRTTGADGADVFYGSQTMPETGWTVVASVETQTALAEARSSVLRAALLVGIALGIMLALGYALERRIAAPLQLLTDGIERAAREVRPAPVTARSPAELARLTDAFNDMVEQRAAYESRLVHERFHDELTGLPNRAMLMERLHAALSQHDARDTSLALLFVDLDRFKRLNEAFGPAVGDDLLREVADRLRGILRPGDIAVRLGADEFVVLCERLITTGQAEGVAERVQACLQAPFSAGGAEARMTASIGIAIADGSSGPDDLLRDADVAMTTAKIAGGARHEFFARELRDRASRRLSIEHDLHSAVERDEIAVVYQPVVDLVSGRIVGAEALARWTHPERGAVPPSDFIPVAEEAGLIDELGATVLERACAAARAWREGRDPIAVHVNLSAHQLARPDLPDLIGNMLAENDLPASALVMELTEGTLLAESSATHSVLGRLKEIGLRLSVDDFGTGYSSLAYLSRFHVFQLKIDRSFIAALHADSGRSALVAAIMDMARALGLDVVAEGVETRDQARELVRLGCRSAQGFLFSPGVPQEAFAELLDAGPLPRVREQ